MTLSAHAARSRLLLSILLVCSVAQAGAQTSGSISGFLRDASGLALPDVSLMLSGGSSQTPLHASTDKFGAFHFDTLALVTYQLTAEKAGNSLAPNRPWTLSAQTPALHLDLTLTPSGGSVQAPAPLQLQAAGIRGYIDPGGYSAPAGAAAASNLLQSAANLNRLASPIDGGKEVACAQETTLLQAVRDHPESAIDHRRLGQHYLAQHQHEKALTELQQARRLDAHDPGTLLSLADALLENRQFTAAHALLRSDASGADRATIDRLLARSDEGQGAFAQASKDYLAAASLAPTAEDFYGAGYELILAGSPAAAADIFDLGMTRYPDSVTLLIGKGTAAFLRGKTAEATRVFLRCATLHADDARPYPFLSASFAISGVDPDAVDSTFRAYDQAHPDRADAAYFYGLTRMHRGGDPEKDPPSAETLFRRAVQLQPGLARAHLQLGTVYFDRRDYTDAAREFATTLHLDPGLWETHYKLSLVYQRSQQTALADQEMHLFLAAKNKNSAGDQASLPNLEEFLSVFVKPGAASALTCTTP